MWKKDETTADKKQPVPEPTIQKSTINIMNDNPSADANTATIGASITIKGEIIGSEDLIVLGAVDGSVVLEKNNVVVGESGRVTANIRAKNIRVEGSVKGEMVAAEKIAIKPSGKVIGDIRSPSVILEDGCKLKGSVDMDADGSTPRPVAKPAPKV